MKRICIALCAIVVSLAAVAGEVVWFDGTIPITYALPKRVDPVVATAFAMWKDDMRQVTGLVPIAAKKPSIRVVQGNGQDDGFSIYIKGGQIVVEGHNARGTAYGILELSRLAGVSPWIWWGDVVPERRNRLVIDSDFAMEHTPSVAYRGIFINDEDWSTRPWSCKNFEKGPEGHIGPRTYRKIFELLLRLRANTIWPAMHEGTTAFFRVPGAKAVADSCGIVIGTSHCEPLLRNNVGEWNVGERGRFNYKTNREAVQQYWIERLKEVAEDHGDRSLIAGKAGIKRPVPMIFAAADYEKASAGAKIIQMLGHSMRAVALCLDGSLTYRFSIDTAGAYTLRTALIPTHAVDSGDIRYSVSVDGNEPTVYSLKEPFRSEQWKQNVLRGQTIRDLSVNLAEGVHTLTIRALDDHIVVDEWSLVISE